MLSHALVNTAAVADAWHQKEFSARQGDVCLALGWASPDVQVVLSPGILSCCS